jgi:two-component system, sensor histidine kinase
MVRAECDTAPPRAAGFRPVFPDVDREAFADEQLRIVWDHARIGLLVATAGALMLAVYLHDAAPAPWVHAWVLAKLAVAAMRLEQSRTFARVGGRGKFWRGSTRVLLTLDGAVWGIAGAGLAAADIPTASLVTAALACVSCIATFGLQVSLLATASYVAPILVLSSMGLFWRLDGFGLLSGLGLSMLLGLQLATARQVQRRVAEGFALRRQAQALVREKDEALGLALRQSAVKSQFLGNVSHELRTPLHGMLGLAELLRREVPEGSSRRRLDLIEASGRHLLSLINDLLEVSRGEVTRPSLQVATFDLAELVDQVTGLHTFRAEARGLQFVVRSNLLRPCWVLGDARRVAQVLHNLLGNAIKFTDEGGVSLRLNRVAHRVMFEVRDSGPGIALADQERIFEAFARADDPVAAQREGAGLGLTIARELARAMDGDVLLDSRPGEGTCFCFSACLPDSAVAVNAGIAPTAVAPAPHAVHGQVLLAEDDDVNAMIGLAGLQRMGLAAERVLDGRAAVRAAMRSAGRPDLILMDCRMPQLDGYGATREIRAQEYALGWPRVPIIALTATVTDLGRTQCMEAGMDDFLAKPFSPDELAAVVRAWLTARVDERVATRMT